VTTATSFRTARSDEGLMPLLGRIAAVASKKAADDPDCMKAKEDTQAFFATNPDRTFHLRLACETEFGLFLEWPAAGEARFVLTQRFSPSFSMTWYMRLPIEMAGDVLTDADLLDVWRVVVPEDQRTQARQMAAQQRRIASAAKKRRPFRR
jgi:hypothetical protein